MDSTDLKRWQVGRIQKAIAPTLRFLQKLERRMLQEQFPKDDELWKLGTAAHAAMHRLSIALHYLSCKSGVAGKPKKDGFDDPEPPMPDRPLTAGPLSEPPRMPLVPLRETNDIGRPVIIGWAMPHAAEGLAQARNTRGTLLHALREILAATIAYCDAHEGEAMPEAIVHIEALAREAPELAEPSAPAIGNALPERAPA